ncbi:MAG: DUF1573 domain-containing protein [Kiritimatiellae bacterium]|nr:DUF1573 domain-containing protein [Kiritimatiellia bacterium]
MFGIYFCLMAALAHARPPATLPSPQSLRASVAGGCVALRAGDLPRLICDEPEYCFGTLSNTSDVPHTFVLANEGDANIDIYRVQNDCGCILVRLENRIIHPGEQIAVKVRFILAGRAGRQHKRVTIISNDPDQPRLTLSLVGEAVAEVEVKPDRIYWGNLRSDAAEVKTVDIKFQESAPGHVTGAGVMSPAFDVAMETNKSGLTYRLQIWSVPPLELGRFATNVWITTDSPRHPQLTVPMHGRVVGDIYTVPDELWLSSDINQPVTRLLMVQSGRRHKFKIVRVDPPFPDMDVTVRTTLFKGYRVELRNLRPLPELDGRTLTIVTDCPTSPTLTVPFRIGQPPGN